MEPQMNHDHHHCCCNCELIQIKLNTILQLLINPGKPVDLNIVFGLTPKTESAPVVPAQT